MEIANLIKYICVDFVYLTHHRNLSQDILKLLSLKFFVEIVVGMYQGSITMMLKVSFLGLKTRQLELATCAGNFICSCQLNS